MKRSLKRVDFVQRHAVSRRVKRHAYLLLETVIATGLLIAGLAVIGTQYQSSKASIHEMKRRIRAITLAELKLAELDMGLVELESFDEIEEEDFGPRFPDFGWRLITEETSIDDLFLLQLDVLHYLREDDYRPDEFEFDLAETVFTAYAYRAAPRPLNLIEDFGLEEEKAEELSEDLANLGIEGLTIDSLDPGLLANLDFEQFVEVLPLLSDIFGFDLKALTASLPPDIARLLDETKDEAGDEGDEGDDEDLDGAS